MKELLKKYRPVFLFLTKALIFYILWLLVLTLFPDFVYGVHFQLIHFQAWASAHIISLLGFEGGYVTGDPHCLGHLFMEGKPSVCVGTGCSGLEMFVVYVAFILIMNNGAWKRMLWFLPLGLLSIVFLNIIRIVSLAFIFNFTPDYLQFNHKYTFVLVVYGAIFGLWYLWVNKVANKNGKKA